MPEHVVFYQLGRTFVHRGHDVPADSKQLIHYTLAIGHHIGVIDCFSARLEIPCGGFARWIARLPKGEARRKLEGLSRFGEIEIAAPHVHLLKEALNAGVADGHVRDPHSRQQAHGDDTAGPPLAEMLSRTPAGNWDVVDGGSAPENEVQRVRSLRPSQALVVDAAEMGLQPGEIRLIDESIVADRLFATTHTLPLTFLIKVLRDFVPEVQLLAIQPSLVAFSCPLSPEVRRAVEIIHKRLREGMSLDTYKRL
jgi:hydrogenase 3 maturation protease